MRISTTGDLSQAGDAPGGIPSRGETDGVVCDAVALRGVRFEDFYEAEHRSLVGLAFVLCGSRTGAEDIAQEAFISAYRNWGRLSMYDDPGAWMRRVVGRHVR